METTNRDVEDALPLAVVTGCTSGLGAALTHTLLASGWRVVGWAQEEEHTLPPLVEAFASEFIYQKVDVQWADDIADALIRLGEELTERGETELKVDALINCAGINYLKPFEQIEAGMWEQVMDTNARAIWLTTRLLLPYMANAAEPMLAGTVLNIVSNAAHMPMTHSLVYNASKAAALMITKQMARELFKSHGLTVFSLSPNKMAGTHMSREIEAAVPALRGWTPEEAADYQRKALPTGMETPPETVAEFIAFILSTKRRHIYLHGCDIPYGG